MKRYKSKYQVALLVQSKDIREKELEVASLSKKKQTLVDRILKEITQIELFKEELSKGGPMDSSFFMGSTDFEKQKKIKREIALVDEQLVERNKEYLMLIRKRDKMIELDMKSQKEFYKEIEKKEMKEIEEYKLIANQKERGDEHAN